jgi:DNA adenine methylase
VEIITAPAIAPLIKWPGGKRAIAHKILPHFPKAFRRYFEPFFGGGAVFFALQPRHSILSDLNKELIDCYQIVRDRPNDLIRRLSKFRNSEEAYYQVRDSCPRTPVGKAARFIYLTRLSFNGIHRVNLKGEFNVPYGHKTHLSPVDSEGISRASGALAGAKLIHGDFESVTAEAADGDVVYFDPPYTVAHANNGFVKYNEHIFSWDDQTRLAAHARKLAARGCLVILSNANHTSVRNLYPTATEYQISRASVIAASSHHRGTITESLFVLRRAK